MTNDRAPDAADDRRGLGRGLGRGLRVASRCANNAFLRRLGAAAAMPFAAEAFDFIVCRAAFKNFGDPHGALREMHRTLAPGGEALIIDMSRDASDLDIDEAVDGMTLRWVDAMMTRAILKHPLRHNAYSGADFEAMACASPFRAAEVRADVISLDVWLRRAPVEGQ